MNRRLALLTWLVVAAAAPASAQRFTALGIPDSDVLASLQRFQAAVASGNRTAIADMVAYPLRVNRGPEQHTVIAGRKDLLARYAAVFTADVRRAIAATNLNDVLGGVDGVAVGRGAAWFTSTCTSTRPIKCQVRLSSINQRAGP
ncbi:MAG: hypothetical protein ACREK8_00975 [Gemmatimonadales bacterium]